MAKFKDVLEIVREDDFVEYFVFQNIINVGQLNKVDSLANTRSQIQTIISKYQKGYIWQKDEFNLIVRNTNILHPVDDNEEILPVHLYGVTHYGDNIEDEWFIVFLLIQITKEMPGVIARVIDSDGEFLLIEAADFLPKWATPETCDKRVYIYNGEVHIIPVSKVNDEDDSVTVTHALQRIISQPELTRANINIQKAVKARIEGYPEKITKNLHHANLYVPAAVAALLKEKPSLVAAAVTAFTYRDPIDMRACRIMRYFPPETRVMCRVTFTKCLYAMLVHQKYIPDRRTGWNLPAPNSSLYNAHSLGIKLACGFEILASQYKTTDNNNDLTTDRAWHKYKQNLLEKGYFKDLLEGSQEYTLLEEAAQEYFKSCITVSQPPTGKIVLDLIKNIEYDIDELKAEENSLPPPDDDRWLDICPEELEQMMRERYGNKSSTCDITSNLSNFLSHVSGLEGAEFPNEQQTEGDAPPIRPKRGIKPRKSIPNNDVPAEDDDDSNKINFDHESFSCAVQNILDFVVPDDSWDLESDESGMSSYEDESEMDLGKHQKGQPGDTPVSELKQYMDQMDRELSTTTMGKSFHLAQPKKKGMEDSFSDIENFEPVDIDMNALKNILESYQAQMGSAGPASNMLGPMGVRLDKMGKE